MSETIKFDITSTGKEYKVIQDTVTWSQAVQNSITFGGNLAQFETEVEASSFWEVFSESDFYRTLDQKEIEQFDHSIEAVKKLWDAASAIDPDLKK